MIYLVHNNDYSSSSRSNSLDWSDGWGKKRDNVYRVKCRVGWRGGGFYNDVRIVCGGDKRILEMHWLVTIF